MEEWIQQHIHIPGFTKEQHWKSIHSEITQEFIRNSQSKCLFITINCDTNLAEISIDKPPKINKNKKDDDVAYFIRKQLGMELNEDNIKQSLITSTLKLHQTAESILDIMEKDIATAVFSFPWNEASRKELMGLYHKFMASLTESSNDENDTMRLYIPSQFGSWSSQKHHNQQQSNDLSFDCITIQQMEVIAIHWIRQIKSALNSHEYNIFLEELGPMEELSFWISRSQQLIQLSQQIQSSDAMNILDSLDQVQSKFSKAVKALEPALSDAVQETQNRVKCLNTLEGPCAKLSSLHPSNVPSVILEFLACLQAMHSTSEYYDTHDKISHLVRKIIVQIINQCTSSISLDEIFHGDIQASIQKLNDCMACGKECKRLYNETSNQVNRALQQNGEDLSLKGWIENDCSIFAQLDVFVQRCEDLIEVCQARIQYVTLIDEISKNELTKSCSDMNGIPFERPLQSIKNGFLVHVDRLAELEYDILDPREIKWNNDFNQFKLALQDLDSAFTNLVSTSLDKTNEIKLSAELFIIFRRSAYRQSLIAFVNKRLHGIRSMFFQELQEIQSEFDNNYRDPPVRNDQCKMSGSAQWSRDLQSRLENGWKALKSAEELCQVSEDMELVSSYDQLMLSLISYQKQRYSDWVHDSVHGLQSTDILARLDIPLLKKVSGRLSCNFDPHLIIILDEASSWDKMGYELPSALLGLFHQNENLRMSREQVMNLVNTYNESLSSMKVIENLHREPLKTLEKKMVPGFTKLYFSARPHTIERFVQIVMSKMREIHRMNPRSIQE